GRGAGRTRAQSTSRCSIVRLAGATMTNTIPSSISPAAERMRLHRERRPQGLRCLTIELCETEIDALIRTGLLKWETRNDPGVVKEAFYVLLERTLDATP